MFWAEQAGLARVVDTMRRLAPSHGARWAPAPLLERLVAEKVGFGAAGCGAAVQTSS
jgi:3-hydroxyacyl-CoA dehydrogenase